MDTIYCHLSFWYFVVKSACESNALSSYIHQHSWVQFSQLTLSMAGAVFEQGEGRSLEADSDDYTDTAASLLTQCLTLVTECLQKVSILNNKGELSYNSYLTGSFVSKSVCLFHVFSTPLLQKINSTVASFVFHVG